MGKGKAVKAKDLDWKEFDGSRMPREGVVYPKGEDKADLVARMRKAFSKIKLRQPV